LKSVFFIVGPTASGKSELAADVAVTCDAEVVSADAFQIYHGLPILTAQPDEATLRKVPHHLVGSVSPNEEMSAAKFREMAVAAIAEINRRGKIVLVVGGSGLYLKSLTHGLAALPAVDAKLRAQLNALSLDELNARLAAVDPFGAEKIDRQNKRRLVRALEIFGQTNAPASAQRREWNDEATGARGVFVFRERAELYSRIDRRVEAMFRDGVAGEVAHAGELSKTAEKTLGLGQVRQMLEGEITTSECIAEMQRATRRYAKRQLTWFRRQPIFEALNLSLLKDHAAAVDWILQKILSFAHPLND